MGRVSSESWSGFTWRFPGVSVFRIVHRTWRLCGDLLDLSGTGDSQAIHANRFAWIIRNWNPYSPTQEPPPSPFWQLTRTMVWVSPGRTDHGLSFLFSTDLQYFWILAVQILRGLSFGLSFLILRGWGAPPTIFYSASGRFARIVRIYSRESRH